MNLLGLRTAATNHRQTAAHAVDPLDITIAGAQAELAEAYLRRAVCRGLRAVPDAPARPPAALDLRGGTLSGLGANQVQRPPTSVRLREPAVGQTNPGFPSPLAALELREEAPFPLVKVRALPRPTPVPDAVGNPASAFNRALNWTLKSFNF